MGKKLWLAAGAAIGGVLVYANQQPDSFRVERSRWIAASPGQVFGWVNDFRQWRQWSPWEEKDANLARGYSGADSGVGAVYQWMGNREVGTGRMEILQTVPNERIVLALDFQRPIKAHHRVVFEFVPEDGGTRVAWVMSGERNLIGKLFGLFVDMEKMVGPDFEHGLQRLEQAATTPTTGSADRPA
jgi:uncharacterized protein YndB with AHSA1/START domain